MHVSEVSLNASKEVQSEGQGDKTYKEDWLKRELAIVLDVLSAPDTDAENSANEALKLKKIVLEKDNEVSHDNSNGAIHHVDKYEYVQQTQSRQQGQPIVDLNDDLARLKYSTPQMEKRSIGVTDKPRSK